MQTSVYDQPSVSNLMLQVVNREEIFALGNGGGASAKGRDSSPDCFEILTYITMCAAAAADVDAFAEARGWGVQKVVELRAGAGLPGGVLRNVRE
jgi:hypothetical protein